MRIGVWVMGVDRIGVAKRMREQGDLLMVQIGLVVQLSTQGAMLLTLTFDVRPLRPRANPDLARDPRVPGSAGLPRGREGCRQRQEPGRGADQACVTSELRNNLELPNKQAR